MKPKYWLVLGAITAAAAQSAACSSKFSSCTESRTCAPKGGTGGMGEAGDTATAEAGEPENSETGGVGGNDESVAHEGGAGGEAGATSPQCDSDVDLDSDPKNCGRCGHDCLGGECTMGTCQPLELARNQGAVLAIALDDHFIYWGGDSSSIAKKSIDNSGTSTELVPAAAKEYAYSLVVVDQTLFWSNDWKDNAIRGCALPSCSAGPQELITASTPARGLFYSEPKKTLYFTQQKAIWQKALPGGQTVQITPTTELAANITSDGQYVYWSEYSPTTGTSSIRKIPVSGGKDSGLADGLSYLTKLVAYERVLYVLEDPTNGTGVQGDARIFAIPLPNGVGSGTVPEFANAGAKARQLAVDDSGVYWTETDGNLEGSIRHCPLTGCTGPADVLASAAGPEGIATDARAVYWVSTNGQVMKLAK